MGNKEIRFKRRRKAGRPHPTHALLHFASGEFFPVTIRVFHTPEGVAEVVYLGRERLGAALAVDELPTHDGARR